MPKTRDPNEQKEKFCIEEKNLNIFVFHAMNLFPTFPIIYLYNLKFYDDEWESERFCHRSKYRFDNSYNWMI